MLKSPFILLAANDVMKDGIKREEILHIISAHLMKRHFGVHSLR